MSDFEIENIPHLGTNQCTRCGNLGVRLTFAITREFLFDPVQQGHKKIMVDQDGQIHQCKIEDIKVHVNFNVSIP